MRQFTVGLEANPDAIDAKFENGVLSLVLKKVEKSESERLEVKLN